jgi:CheY-like chemotaxis protein/two-component sensor histidine kinase
LTRQLLLFSRKQVMQPANLDLNEVVGNLTKMLQRILGEDIALRSEYGPNLPLVRADAGMLEQVLLNLAVNSRDAMPNGGRLTIATSEETVDESRARQNPEATAGRHICLSVTDTGCGIPPEILPHIFEPFFTTKEVGKGTGLGLATVYGIVKQHGGWIELATAPGQGTTFRVYLPAVEGPRAAAAAEAAPAKLPCGSETILIVEDETSLRALIAGLLRRCGYTVFEAASGPAALAIWNQHQASIHLLLTDVMLPEGMSGVELAKRLLAEKPQLNVLCASGYSPDLPGPGAALLAGLSFLQKPLSYRKLAEAIRECLDQPQDRGKFDA